MYETPYLTRDLPGTGGVIKATPEDFQVTEIPLYPALGVGEHVYFEIEKRGMTTFEAIERIARALGVPDRAIGYAGLKDSRAVTRQVLSVHQADEAKVGRLEIPGIQVHWIKRHRNKLRPGHLFGNRFRITVREVVPDALDRARPILDVLERRGVPNAFGVQRFGSRRDSHLIGRAICIGRDKEVVDRIVGNPSPFENNPIVVDARRRYEAGELEESLGGFPPTFVTERNLLRGLLGSGGDYSVAARRIPRKIRKLYLAAFQSYLFNRTLWRRLESFDRILVGDLAYKHVNGAVFSVEEAGPEIETRVAAFEISPSGPLHGYKAVRPFGDPLRIEDGIVQEEGFDRETLPHIFRNVQIKGERRALRIPILELEIHDGEEEGTFVLTFALPRGSYATTVLREVMKTNEDALVTDEAR
jgi:tRNA pseudouridine13 synthase